MTVGQLIAALQKMDQQAEMRICDYTDDFRHGIHAIIPMEDEKQVLICPTYPD